MGRYSINDIERLSGIKAHTIRIWEKRYDIFKPERTDTNIRYYTDDTLRKILKISILHNNGIKISKIADLSESEINKQVEQSANTVQKTGFENQIDALIVCMIELNEGQFLHITNQLVEKYAFEKIVLDVFYPLFERIGVLWQIGSINPAQEHFISNLIRQKIIVAIDRLPVPQNGKTFLLFLHENELHELGLLFYHYLLREKGFKVVYIGQAVPYKDLMMLKRTIKFDYLVTSFISNFPEGALQDYLDRLSHDFSSHQIVISGFQVTENAVSLPSNMLKVKDSSVFNSFLDSLS